MKKVTALSLIILVCGFSSFANAWGPIPYEVRGITDEMKKTHPSEFVIWKHFSEINEMILKRHLTDEDVVVLNNLLAKAKRWNPTDSDLRGILFDRTQNTLLAVLLRQPEMQSHLLAEFKNQNVIRDSAKLDIFLRAVEAYQRSGKEFPLLEQNQRILSKIDESYLRSSEKRELFAAFSKMKIVTKITAGMGLFALASAASGAQTELPENSTIDSTSHTNVGRSASFGDFGVR